MTVDLARDSILVTLGGSQAHGTARAASDVDLRGVCIAPLRLRVSLYGAFEQFEGTLQGPLREIVGEQLRLHPTAGPAAAGVVECVVFDLAKFLRLCAAANPNALEILFADERDWLYHTPAWRRIHDVRQLFLTDAVRHTYLGYALAQLARIRTHRGWLLQPPTAKPSREQFGLPGSGTMSRHDRSRIETAVDERIRGYGVADLELPKAARTALKERLVALWSDQLAVEPEELETELRHVAVASLRLPEGVVDALEAERKYRAAMKQWDAYESWRRGRNPVRAELERRHGYDTKHAMHLLRLMRTGLELLETGELRVRRPDADELNAIRDGALSYDELVALAHELDARLRGAGRSDLPEDIDLGFVDALAWELIDAHRK